MTLLQSEDKIQKICDTITKETLVPAEKKAEQIVEKAKRDAEKILQDASDEADAIRERLSRDLMVEKESFHTSLELSARQVASDLRQKIIRQLFVKELQKSVQEALSEKEVVGNIIRVITEAIRESGLDTKIGRAHV